MRTHASADAKEDWILARDDTPLFLERFAGRMPRSRLEERQARDKSESKHHVWDIEVDALLYECPPEEIWAVRPTGADAGGVDLWEVIGTTDSRRLLLVVGRMGDDGLFRLISARALTVPEGESDRERVREYREQLVRREDGAGASASG